jgi:hypothetical protein
MTAVRSVDENNSDNDQDVPSTQATPNRGVKTIIQKRPVITRRVVNKNYRGRGGEVHAPVNAPTPRPGAMFHFHPNGKVEVNAANKPAVQSVNRERPINPRVLDEDYSDSSDDVPMTEATPGKGAKTVNQERHIAPTASSKQSESTVQ